MANKIFVGAVVALWLGSMSWLLVDKVLPSFHDGEPPMAAGFETGVPVAWQVAWGDRSVGYAATVRSDGVLNTTNVDSRVVLREVPLLDLVPTLMRQVVGDIGKMTFDAHTHLEFDSLDNFSKFKSSVTINDVPSILQLNGTMRGSFLELKVNFGEVEYSPKVAISDQGALSEALFPDARLPFLYVGKRWHEEVYNPFRSPSAPVERLEAEVTGIETIEFGDETERAMVVEFVGPPAPGVPEEARLQARAWVRAKDGLVLQQDVIISNSTLRFTRLPEAKAAEVAMELFQEAPTWGWSGWLRDDEGGGPTWSKSADRGQGEYTPVE